MPPYRFLNRGDATNQSKSGSSPAHFQTPSRGVGESRLERSSQFASTPRFATPSTSRAVSSTAEIIESFGDDEEDNVHSSGTHLEEDGEVENAAMSDSFDDLLAIHERRRKPNIEAVLKEQATTTAVDRKPSRAVATPPPRKRRRVQQEREAIYVSSSPSPHDSPVLSETSDASDEFSLLRREEARPDSKTGSAIGGHNPLFSNPSIGTDSDPTRTERKSRSSRFKSTAAPPTPFSPPASSARPAFVRPSIPPKSAASAVTSENLLPDAFSPSKRRGRTKDYLRHGMAQTMLGWILAAGQEEEDRSRLTQQPRGPQSVPARTTPEYERVVHIVKMRNDGNERGILVSGHDGQTYLLAGSPANIPTGNGTAKVGIGSRIGLRKGNLSWAVPFDNLHGRTEAGDSPTSTSVMVSALWDLDPT